MEWWAYEILALFAGLLPGSVLAVSAHAVIMNIVSTLYMVYLGMAVSGNILVGNALGANMPKRAQLTSRLTIAMTASVSCAVAALVFVFRFEIPKLLINDPVAVERAATLLLAIVPYEVVDATNCVIQGIYRGTGRQHMAARLNAIAFYVVGIPLAALLAFGCHWDVEGLWIGFAAGMAFSLGTCSYVLYHASWQQMADEAQARTAH
jgi:MATE family multidrug resistance protein